MAAHMMKSAGNVVAGPAPCATGAGGPALASEPAINIPTAIIPASVRCMSSNVARVVPTATMPKRAVPLEGVSGSDAWAPVVAVQLIR